MKKYTDLIEMLEKIFGKGSVSRTIGTRTNVVRFPKGKQPIDPTVGNFDVEGTAIKSPDLVQTIENSIEDRMGDITKMNDQELLTYTANVRRLLNFKEPPVQNADVIKFGSGEEIKGKGLEQLIEKQGTVNPPTTVAGRLETQGKKLEKAGEDLKEITEPKSVIGDIIKDYGDFDKYMQSSQKTGYVRATVRQIMREDIQAGKLKLPKELQDQVMQGLGEPIDIYRKVYGEGALEQIDSLADDLGQFRTEEEAAKFARSKYTFEPKVEPVDESMTYDELGNLIKKGTDEPEGKAQGGIIGYAMGGRIGFQEGGDIRNVIKEFEKKGTTPSSLVGPNGIEFKLVTGQFSGKPVYKAFYPKDYDFSKFGAIHGSTGSEFQPEYFFKHIMAPEGTYFDYEKNDFLPTVSTPEVPTVDPFSVEQVSAQEQASFTQPQAEIFPQQELPTVTPEAPFQPYVDKQTSYDDVSNRLENVFNNPAIKGFSDYVTGTGSDQTYKDINQLTSQQQDALNQTIRNAELRQVPQIDPFSGEILTTPQKQDFGNFNVNYMDYPKGGINYNLTGVPMLDETGFKNPYEQNKVMVSSILGNPVDQLKTSFGQFTYDPQQQQVQDKYDFQRYLPGNEYVVNMNVPNPTVPFTPYVPNVEGANELKNRYNQYLSASAPEGSDVLYAKYKANVKGKADGGRIGYAKGKRVKSSIDKLLENLNKKTQGKKSMESVNPKTGEVTVPKKPIRRAEEPTGMTTMDVEPEIVDERSIKKTKSIMTIDDLKTKHKDAFEAHDQIFNVDINDKIAPDMIAESMAETRGKDYFSLSQEEQSNLYKKALAYVDDARMTKRQNKPIEGGFSFNDPDIKVQMQKAMQEGNKRSKEMRAMGLDPAKSKDYDEYIKIKEESGDKNFNKYFDDLEIKTKFKGVISDDLLNQILIDDNPQRKAEVIATIEQGLTMQEKGMSPEEIVNILKNTTRTKQAEGGIAGLL